MGKLGVRAQTLTEVPEEDIKEGDVDGSEGASVVLNLAQHHLQPSREREERGPGKRRVMDKHIENMFIEKDKRVGL